MIKPIKRGNLRIEKSKYCSGKIINEHFIPILKEQEYIVKDYGLIGDAPKQFIKAYFYLEDSTVRKSSSGSWPAFIAKSAEKWFPHESVIEYMINRIGQVLSLNMNEIRLVTANGQIRFLSKYFLNENEKLIHGAEICGQHLGDISFAVQFATEKENGYGVVRELVGHGIGRHLHEEPQVPNYGKRGTGAKLKEGMVIAIEPMINLGTKNIFHDKDGWTIRTEDAQPSAHYEHTICVQRGKADVLSSFVEIEVAEKENPYLFSDY